MSYSLCMHLKTLIPVFTLAGVNLVVMINAAVIIEVIFAWPGIGRLLYEGIFRGSLAAPVRKEIAPRCTVACHLN